MVAVGLLSAVLAAPARAETETDSARLAPLSNESTLSRWAHVAAPSAIYRSHSYKSGLVGRLRFFTEDDFPEVYLVLARYRDSSDRDWVKVRVPKRPNGRVGWVPRDALGEYRTNTQQLVIDRGAFKAKLYDKGHLLWSSRIGVGTVGNKTPSGRFWVREKFRFKNLPMYGEYAIGTAAYAPHLSDWPNGGVVGIHGTSQPELIPGRISHGCIRVPNENVARLWRLVKVGTPIWVR